MTDDTEDTGVLLRAHPSLRNFLRHFILPALLVPGGIVLLRLTIWPTLPFYPWMMLFILVGSAFPLVAWLETRFYTYEVRDSGLTTARNTGKVFQHEDYDWLTLVTCELYNPFNQSYLFRRVVRAVLVDISPQ